MKRSLYIAVPVHSPRLKNWEYCIGVTPRISDARIGFPEVKGSSLVNRPEAFGAFFGFEVHEDLTRLLVLLVIGRVKFPYWPCMPLTRFA